MTTKFRTAYAIHFIRNGCIEFLGFNDEDEAWARFDALCADRTVNLVELAGPDDEELASHCR